MANYHFRIKSDKRKNGSRTSAVEHAAYIDREGKYQGYDKRNVPKMHFGNTIYGYNSAVRAMKGERILYTSPFGNIKQNCNGIHVSDGASTETAAIALCVAKEIYGREIRIHGSMCFLNQSVIAVDEMQLPVQLQAELEQKRYLLEEKHEREQREFGTAEKSQRLTEHFGAIYGRHSNQRRGLFQSGSKHYTLSDASTQRMHLPKLSSGCMDDQHTKRTTVLLSPDALRELFAGARRLSDYVRWSHAGRKRLIEKTAKDILVHVEQDSEDIFAASHVQYINRESAFAKRGGCIFKGNHLPKWAKGNPKIFFNTADRCERSNGERYKEIEFALPAELGISEYKKIIQLFCERHLKNFYYDFAIHDKIGSMSNGERQPHVHIMFSTREIDAQERIQERSPALFFSRANSKDPALGGCKKADKWRGTNRVAYLHVIREDFASIQNEILRENGIRLQVDHRSLKEQRERALAEGNIILAKLLDRIPESSVGPVAILKKDDLTVQQQKQLRRINQQRINNVVLRYLLKDFHLKQDLKSRIQNVEEKFQALKNILKQSPESDSVMVQQQKDLTNILTAYTNKACIVLWGDQAIEQSMLDAMTQKERELWQELKRLGSERKNWQELRERLRFSEGDTPKNRYAVQQLIEELDITLERIDKKIHTLAKEVNTIFTRLQLPANKKRIRQQIGIYLNDEFALKEELRKLTYQVEKLLHSFEINLQQKLQQRYAAKSYTVSDVQECLKEEIALTQKQEDLLISNIKALKKQVISPARAMSMSKNIYVKGAYKKLRSKYRELKKAASTMDDETYMGLKNQLDQEKSALDKLCSTPAAKAKIEEIATGILRKNNGIAKKYEALLQKYQQINISKNTFEMSAKNQKEMKTTFQKDFPGTKYRVISAQDFSEAVSKEKEPFIMPAAISYPTPISHSHLIADALRGDAGVVPLVLRHRPTDIDGNWTLLSEAEKEERKIQMERMDDF